MKIADLIAMREDAYHWLIDNEDEYELCKKIDCSQSKLNDSLSMIDSQIIKIDNEAAKTSNSKRALFLEGKSSGLNEAYRFIKKICQTGE